MFPAVSEGPVVEAGPVAHPVAPPVDGNGGDHDDVEVQRSDLGPLSRLSAPVRALLQGAGGDADYGVGVCGAGLGIAMAANKVPGVRAAPVPDVLSAQLARQHNDANVLCLGERLIDPEVAVQAVTAWLDAEIEGGRHEGRIAKLDALGG